MSTLWTIILVLAALLILPLLLIAGLAILSVISALLSAMAGIALFDGLYGAFWEIRHEGFERFKRRRWPKPHPNFGEDYSPKILILGRTGVGKSSLINALASLSYCRDRVEVGPIASTTREIRPIEILIRNRPVTLVDTPGIGEIGTNMDYLYALEDWYRYYHRTVIMVLHIVQADQKGHSEDLDLHNFLMGISKKQTFFVANQVDKMKPTREPLDMSSRFSIFARPTEKEKNIKKKMRLLQKQFETSRRRIIPTSVEDEKRTFNMRALEKVIYKKLRWHSEKKDRIDLDALIQDLESEETVSLDKH